MSVRQWIQDHKITVGTVLFVFLFLVVYFFNSIFIYIYPGQTGILFNVMSNEPLPDTSYKEGLYVVAPWNKMYVWDTKLQKKTLDVGALTNNGLGVTVRISAVFRPDPEEMKELVDHIGPDYTDKILVPILFSSVRKVIGKYPPEALYTSARNGLHDEIFKAVQQAMDEPPFMVESLVIENLELPKAIQTAIENKLRLQQEALAYQYILKKEADESKRREIEAASIKKYQDTVSAGLTPETLKWLEIRALYELSKSNNSKVIVMGGGESIPLVLDAKSGQ